MTKIKKPPSKQVDGFENVRILDIKEWQTHIAPIVMRVFTSGGVPLDKIVAFLVFSQPQEQRRDKITTSHVIRAAEAKHIHEVLQCCGHCFGCLDL